MSKAKPARGGALGAQTDSEIVVVSYNIHRAVGGDGCKQPLRIAETIAALDADLIALQEVETPANVAAPRIFLQRLHELGYEAVLGHTMLRGPHHYGNLLLSRLPVLSQQRLDISQPGREPRGLIDVEVAWYPDVVAGTGATGLRCLATHLGLRASERRRQIAAILAHLDEVAALTRTPLVLMGDFNEWWPRQGRLASLNRHLGAAPALASFPSRWPLLALDRLWFGADLELIETEVVRTKATRAASDHLPLRARLRPHLGGAGA
ncbi:hypothetical protein CCR82_02695 [Halochromatium salexigens]|uniref:Endonuclease/exonuclease/phosphatase domain-containing protein n=1 Tax=Halochromatium salexigens TaxID=49447 RepID=A0AAJ0UDI2_HALSE|nr:hypothetical protein [Halochromatium salexigens]